MYLTKYFDEVNVGDRVEVAKTITEADASLYAAATGDFGPVHFDETYAKETRFGRRLAPGIMVAGIATSVLTSQLVGVLGVSIEDRFWFTGPVAYGDTITVSIWISAKDEANRTMSWQASAHNQDNKEVLRAEAILKFPRNAIRT
ncbi:MULTISPECIES: MaoC family dehydratase [unclassified Aurantimonas]|uniref:MaoC family dehydratase n=1 Tax=unclassified Aurantimonas TaxID=2638230 RepID=UPI002E18D71F|nr:MULTISPECIES: MaoC family dehydratase [unclassified Aurantimonas]MEC5293295.1 MaoC family dehydratase [Aurantimonas sp. C2-3-R2]MEC5414389.1 MaoC family dehydratase [Aurantimonas sp. C2-4-R8]